MHLFTIAKKDVLLLIRDRKALLTLVGTPLILTFILGMAFQGMWSAETPPARVLWINEDEGEFGDILFSDVLTMEGVREWVRLEQAQDRQDAREQVQRGRATAYIEVPQGFSQSVREGEGRIIVVGDPASSIRANMIPRVVQRFATELSSRTIIYQALGEHQVTLPIEEIELELEQVEISARIEDGFDQRSSEVPIPMDYYAAGMGVMYLLFTVSHGAGTFLREREAYTLHRMYQAPLLGWEIGAGKFTGIFLTACLQLTAVIVFSHLVYGVAWGDPLGVAALTVTAAFGASGIGLVIAALSKTQSAADALGTAVVLPLAVLGGSMMPLFAMPPVMRTLSKLTVNGWALEGYVRLMFEKGSINDLLPHLGVLVGMGIGFVVLASLLFSRRGALS